MSVERVKPNSQDGLLPFHENVPSFGDWGCYIGVRPEVNTLGFPVLLSLYTHESWLLD